MCAGKYLKRLIVIADIRERAPIGAEQRLLCGFFIVTFSRTATACARWPVARKARAYCIAAVTLSGADLYSASDLSNSLRHSASVVGRGALAIEPVISGLLVVLQPARPAASKAANAVEASRRERPKGANRMATGSWLGTHWAAPTGPQQ
jgi:hypothetical protein